MAQQKEASQTEKPTPKRLRDAHDAIMIDSLLQNKGGIHKSKSESMIRRETADVLSASSIQRGAKVPHSRPPDKLPESIEEMGRKRSEDYQEMDLNDVADGLVIEFGEEESFGAGSTRVNDTLAETLRDVARVLENYPHLVVVEGFTSGGFQPTPRYRSMASLSLARARAAAETMLAESGMNPDLIQVAGLGDSIPIADNVSPGGRKLNRRVRLRVLSLSKARANYLEAQEQG